MDIHRSRFIPFQPSAINALAFSHTSQDEELEVQHSLRLALGRSNGNIEIWNPNNGNWVQERVFCGGKERSVEGLAWIQDTEEENEQGKRRPGSLRLFSIGYSSSITEWNLGTGLPIHHSDGSHSEVWCFAAQPPMRTLSKQDARSGTYMGQDLVAGCADGTLVLLSTQENQLRFNKYLARSTQKKARVLSVTYQDRNTILAGFADSTIRIYNSTNSQMIRAISLGSGQRGGPKEILVWKVKCLPNGDFVSGDSTGDVRIYDGKNFSQRQRLSGHDADILDIAVSGDGNTIFSAGMDRRTCIYRCNQTGGAVRRHASEKWRKVDHKRYHDHDVKALASYDGNSLSVVVSGGIDARPIVVPLRENQKKYELRLPFLPQKPPLISAPQARLVASWWNSEIRVWRIGSRDTVSKKPKVVARLALRGDENVSCVTIASDGRLLAAATLSEVKLFQLIPPQAGSTSTFRIRKLNIPTSSGAKIVRFSSDGKWLALVSPNNDVSLLRIMTSEVLTDQPRIVPRAIRLRRLSRHDKHRSPLNSPGADYRRAITHVAFSENATLFAAADIAGYVDTWVVHGHEDSTAPEVDMLDDHESSDSHSDDESEDEEAPFKQQFTILGQSWTRNPSAHLIPRLDSPPLLLEFEPTVGGSTRPEPNGNPAVHPTRHNPHPQSHALPNADHRLLVISANHNIYHVQTLAGTLTPWSRQNPYSSYPLEFRQLKDRVKGCVWDMTEERRRCWLYGESWLFMFDFAQNFALAEPEDDVPVSIDPVDGDMSASKKRKRMTTGGASRKNTTGAGDAVRQDEQPITKLRKFGGGKRDDAMAVRWTELHNLHADAESGEGFEDEIVKVLEDHRRNHAVEAASPTANKLINGTSALQRTNGHSSQHEYPKSWYRELKYRPILGMVPIGSKDQPLEVLLVERPPWDLDLPARFVGSHE